MNRPYKKPSLCVAFLAAVLVLLHAALAFAQGTGVLVGAVLDASSKKPVADVVVTATSPAMQGEQTVVTDASGQYRIPNLPPGDYSIRLDKETYRPYSRGGIALRAASTIRVNVDLLPETVQAKEEIVVVGRAPTVDVGSSSTGMSINSEFVNRVPIARPGGKGGAVRSFESVGDAAPGAHADAYGMSINGTTSPENNYVIDGISVNDPAYGVLGTPLSMEFIKEVNVVSGGYMPEYGRSTGGIFDVVTKSGSNELHGSIFANFTPGAFEGPRELVRREGQTISTDRELVFITDVGFDIGGPIVKDKLWFYAGFDVAFTRYKLTRSLNRIVIDPATGAPADKDDDKFTDVERIPGTEPQDFFASERAMQMFGKLTWQAHRDHTLTLSALFAPTVSGGGGNFAIDPQIGAPEVANIVGTYEANAHKFVSNALDLSLKWQAATSNKTLLFDTTVGWHFQRFARLPSDDSELGSSDGLAGRPSILWRRTTPALHSIEDFEQIPNVGDCYKGGAKVDADGDGIDDRLVEGPNGEPAADPNAQLCPVTTYFEGGPDFIDDATLHRWQGKEVVTKTFKAAGHHILKGGVDVELMQYDHVKAYSGTVRFRENLSGTAFLDHRMYGFMIGPDQAVIQTEQEAASSSTSLGGFVQDSWSILDKVTLNLGVRYDVQMLFGEDDKLGMTLPNQWSPRVGVIWDPTQQGRAKIYANFARYYESVPLDIVDRSFPGERQISSFHPADPDGAGPEPGCDPRANPAACHTDDNRVSINGPEDPHQKWFITGGEKVPVDPDLKPQSSDEIVVGGEYEIFPDGRLGLQYTKRYMNSVIEDMSRDEAYTYFIGNPGEGIAKDFPKAERDYDAVTVYFSKAFRNQWLAQVSYTVSYLRGNWAGLFRPETQQLDPNINADFDLITLLPNRDGALPGDRTHELKVFGAKEFLFANRVLLDLGGTFKTRSGEPTNYLGSHNLYGASEVFILPRGTGPRLPWVHSVDLHLGAGYKFTKDVVLSVDMDVFNVFNFQAVTAVDEDYTLADVLPIADGSIDDLEPESGQTKLRYAETNTPVDIKADKNPNFGNPIAYQAPRTFRFGMRLSF